MLKLILSNYRFLVEEAMFMVPMHIRPSLKLRLECLITAITKRHKVAAYINGE